jgi:hypothetical protein
LVHLEEELKDLQELPVGLNAIEHLRGYLQSKMRWPE